MNRRDTIIVAVLLNAAVIAVLLLMAVNTDEEVFHERAEFESLTSGNSPHVEVNEHLAVQLEPTARKSDETPILVDLEAVGFDSLLNEYTTTSNELFVVDDGVGIVLEKPSQKVAPVVSETFPTDKDLAGAKIVEIVVKKGDSLDKIARANATTIEAIKKASQLKSERLSIGQILKVPVGLKKAQSAPTHSTVKPSGEVAASEAVYYTVKSGDNPWKIAKQQHLDMDELLRLNHLNEEKARNLKVGDRIRIR
ncbi:MAG: LysM peptidoglycan-binding domain-containing protein [Parachlamydiaceae bacterium]